MRKANWSAPEVRIPASLRLGCVKYLNARPLIHGWRGKVLLDHPSALCRRLAAGELDVALVSSFEYLRHPIYYAVDRVAIGSDGPVYSVILAYQGAIEDLREVVIDPASETSANLLRCWLGERNLPAVLVSAGAMSPVRGRLLIGDQAIRFRQQTGDRYRILDLGAAWKEQIGEPFVYALWLVRPEYSEKQAVAEALRTLAQTNLENLDPVLAAQPVAERAFCEFYFRQCLRFTFGEEEKQGFQRFAELCARRKLLWNIPREPRLV